MPLLVLDDIAEVFPGVYDLASQIAKSSLGEYQRDAAHYLAFCGYDPARALDHASLRAWRQQLASHTALSPRTINRRLAAVKRLVRCCVEMASPRVDPTTLYHFAHVRPLPVAAFRHRLKRHPPCITCSMLIEYRMTVL